MSLIFSTFSDFSSLKQEDIYNSIIKISRPKATEVHFQVHFPPFELFLKNIFPHLSLHFLTRYMIKLCSSCRKIVRARLSTNRFERLPEKSDVEVRNKIWKSFFCPEPQTFDLSSRWPFTNYANINSTTFLLMIVIDFSRLSEASKNSKWNKN